MVNLSGFRINYLLRMGYTCSMYRCMYSTKNTTNTPNIISQLFQDNVSISIDQSQAGVVPLNKLCSFRQRKLLCCQHCTLPWITPCLPTVLHFWKAQRDVFFEHTSTFGHQTDTHTTHLDLVRVVPCWHQKVGHFFARHSQRQRLFTPSMHLFQIESWVNAHATLPLNSSNDGCRNGPATVAKSYGGIGNGVG